MTTEVPEEVFEDLAFIRLLVSSWTRESSSDPEHWSEINRGWGQCAVTSLVVQDLRGGDLVRTVVRYKEFGSEEEKSVSHYYNQLPDGRHVDYTWQQFYDVTVLGREQPKQRTRESLLVNPDTERRYQVLKQHVESVEG